jgi:hypothetical protein
MSGEGLSSFETPRKSAPPSGCNAQAMLQRNKLCRKRKKSRAASPALKIVSTLFPRKIGFDLD